LECITYQVDPQFETTKGFNYRLSILLCRDGFSFVITHAVTKQLLKLAAYKLSPGEIQYNESKDWPVSGREYFELLKKIDVAYIAYQHVEIAIATHKITIAPHLFFEQGNAADIMSAVHTMNADEEILTEPVFDLGPVSAMLMPHYIKEYCIRLFPGATYRNASAVFVKGVMRKHSQLIARQIFINVYASYFEITVIQGLRLLYLNTFNYSDTSDILYFVIFVLEQLGFVPSEQELVLMGEISETSPITEQLRMYCASLHFAENPEGIEYSDVFGNIAMHQHFTLLNIP